MTDTKKYTESLYYSTLFLSQNEIGPQTPFEIFVTICILSAGIFMNSKILGDLAMLVEQLIQSKSIRQEKFDSLNGVMQDIDLNNEEQDQIREYFLKTITLKEKQEEYDIFLDSVCPSLKFKAMMHLFSVCLLKNMLVQKYLKDTQNQNFVNEKNKKPITEN